MQPLVAPQPQNDREWLTLIHATLCDVKDDLGQLKQQHHEKLLEVSAKLDIQNGRVRRLELWWARLAGGLVVVGALATAAVVPLIRQVLGLVP